MSETHRCAVCREEKPWDAEHFSPSTHTVSGYTYRCRQCQAAYARERYARGVNRVERASLPPAELEELRRYQREAKARSRARARAAKLGGGGDADGGTTKEEDDHPCEPVGAEAKPEAVR